MAYTPEAWGKGGPGYGTNDYLYAKDINKMIYLFNQFVVFDNDNTFKGIKIPKTGLTLYSMDSEGNTTNTSYLLTVDEDGILQTEKITEEWFYDF